MPVGTGADWALNGMETGFFASSSDRKFIYQSTLVIEKDITKRLFAFVEYVGNFPSDGGNNQFINSGAGYLIDDRQQIDFHVGFGLDVMPRPIFSASDIHSESTVFCSSAIVPQRARSKPRRGSISLRNDRGLVASHFFASTDRDASSVWARFGL